MIEMGFEGEFLYPKFCHATIPGPMVEPGFCYACPIAPGFAVTAWYCSDGSGNIVVRIIRYCSKPLIDAVRSEMSMHSEYADGVLHLCALIHHFIDIFERYPNHFTKILPMEVTNEILSLRHYSITA